MIVARHWGVALAALAVAASGASAQGKKDAKAPADTCTLAYEKPDEVRDAYQNLNKVLLLNQPEQQKKPLTTAVEKLTLRPDHYSANQSAHEFLLGEALIMWSRLPGEPTSPKRGTIGFLGDKDVPIDLLKTADSLFTNVEKALPSCADRTGGVRQLAWTPLINQVGPLLNAGNVDSAAKVLDRANLIYRESPFGFYFTAQVAFKRDQDSAASVAYERAAKMGAVEVAKDTASNVAGITEFSSFFAPYTGQRAAAVMTAGPAQAAAYQRVITLFEHYLKTYPCAQFAENAQSGVFETMRASGDTAGVRARLTAMSSETKPCTDMWWYNGARDAKDIDAVPLSVALADKAVGFSPWSAGLGNAAAVLFNAKAWDKLIPVARRLTQISPNTPDFYQYLAFSYNGLAEKAEAALKKTLTDSAITAYETGEKLDVNVRVTEFSSDGPKRTIGGTATLVNHAPKVRPGTTKPAAKGAKGAKAAPAAPTAASPAPRQVMVKVEFLDRSGAAVGSDSLAITVNSEAKTPFKIKTENAKIVGYRLALIP